MAEVRDDLVPTDGLTNSSIKFAGLDAYPKGGGANMRFDLFDEDNRHFGTFSIAVPPTADGSVDAMIAEAHQRMKDVLRQWLYSIDGAHRRYSER